jgi:hypothetical protein
VTVGELVAELSRLDPGLSVFVEGGGPPGRHHVGMLDKKPVSRRDGYPSALIIEASGARWYAQAPPVELLGRWPAGPAERRRSLRVVDLAAWR